MDGPGNVPDKETKMSWSRTRVSSGGTLEAAGQVIEASSPDKLIKSKYVECRYVYDRYGYFVYLEWGGEHIRLKHITN